MRAPPPRPLVVLAGIAVVVGVTMTAVGAWRTGVSWDETYHVMRMRNYLASGWYLLDGDLLAGAPGPWEDQRYVYGPVTMGLAHLWTVAWGLEGAGQVSTAPEAFAARHLVVVLISLVGVAATAGLTRVITGRWTWALVTAALLVTVPTWTGHAMFNVKDVPVATGYTLTTLGLAVLWTSSRLRPQVAGCATVAAGIVLAVGTRPGIWPGLALAVAPVLVLALRRSDRLRLSLLVAGLGTAALVLVLVYPQAFTTPLDALLGSALESSRYDGRRGDWWYLPLFLVIELPTLHLLLGLVGVVASARLLRHDAVTAERVGLVLVLVLLQALALPAIAVLRESNLYTGLRQLLFAAPALAVLATLGVQAALRSGRGRGAVGRRVAPALVGVALLGPLVAQAQLFPYNYAYSSEPAALVGPVAAAHDRTWEIPTDYWRTSVRELAPLVPRGGLVTCSPSYDDEGRFVPYSHESHQNCANDPVGPLAPYEALRSGSWPDPPTQFLAIDAGTDVAGGNCRRLGEVTRRLHWRTVTMSYVAACDLVLEPYPPGGLAFSGDGTGGEVLLDGWSLHRADPGAGIEPATGPGEASLGFTLPHDLAAGPLVLRATATGAEDVGLVVNGDAVPVVVRGTALTAAFDAETVAALGEDRLVLHLSVPPGAEPLRLLALRLSKASS